MSRNERLLRSRAVDNCGISILASDIAINACHDAPHVSENQYGVHYFVSQLEICCNIALVSWSVYSLQRCASYILKVDENVSCHHHQEPRTGFSQLYISQRPLVQQRTSEGKRSLPSPHPSTANRGALPAQRDSPLGMDGNRPYGAYYVVQSRSYDSRRCTP